MAKKNHHTFTQAGVLAYVRDNRGTRYQCSQLAKVFHCGPPAMRIYLNNMVAAGQIISAVCGRYRMFYLLTEQEEADIRRAQEALEGRKFTPLKGYEQSLREMVKLREGGR